MSRPHRVSVSEGFGQLAHSANLTEPGIQIVAQVIEDNTGVFVANCAAMVGASAADLTLDGIQIGELLQRLGGNWRIVGQIEELAPDV